MIGAVALKDMVITASGPARALSWNILLYSMIM